MRKRKINDDDLIKILMRNARISYSELARTLGVSDTAIKKRLKKLEKEGVIRKYTVDVDYYKLGYEVVSLIGIDTTPEAYLKILEKLENSDNVINLYSVTGDHMILAKCVFKTTTEFYSFIKTLEKMEGVKRVCPSIVLRKIK